MSDDFKISLNRHLLSLPRLYEDSYEAVRLTKLNIAILVMGIILCAASLFEVTSHLLRIDPEVIFPVTVISQIALGITTVVYNKNGFKSKSFQISDFITKIVFLVGILYVIYNAGYWESPRTGWWVIFFLYVVLIAQISEYHLVFAIFYFVLPSIIAILYLYDPKLDFSTFHKAFGFFIGLIGTTLYYFQCRLKQNELKIKENNIQLLEEINKLNIDLERERISRELHDSLGATLTGNIIYTEIAQEQVENEPNKLKETLHTIENLSRDALIKMREAVYSIMEDQDLIHNFSDYLLIQVQDLLKVKNIDFEYHCSDKVVEFLTPKMKFNLYRIIGEWLTNILRHSDADKVSLTFSQNNNSILLTIFDNGMGFNQDNKVQNGSGINNINHRVNELGGTFKIESENGAKLIVQIYL